MTDTDQFPGDSVSDPSVQRDLGRHDAEIESLQKEMKQLRESLDKVCSQLSEVNSSITDFKGRYKGGLWVIGGIASAGGATDPLIGSNVPLIGSNVPHLPR